MKPIWLIQTNMEGVDTFPMITEALAQGMQVHEIEHRLGTKVDFDKYHKDDCIICYGDIDFVRQVRQRAPFIPGAYCNFDNMRCSTYFTYLGEHLLNRQYLMMPIGDLLRRWDELIDIFYPWASVRGNKSLFVRPDSGVKPFTGDVVKPEEKLKIQSIVQSVGPETLVVVAPEKHIIAEWRFVVCLGNVVTGCQYLPVESPDYPPSSFRLAEVVAANKWQPDLCYTVDIAESDGKFYVLEINSLSCAGLYVCDMSRIVHWVSIVGLEEWESYNIKKGG